MNDHTSKPRFPYHSTPFVQPYPGLSDDSIYAPHAGKMFKKSSFCGGQMRDLGQRPAMRIEYLNTNEPTKRHNGRPM